MRLGKKYNFMTFRFSRDGFFALLSIVNFLLFPAYPYKLLAEEINQQLVDVNQQLFAYRYKKNIAKLTIDTVEKRIQALHRHLAFASRTESFSEHDKTRYVMRIAAIDRLYTASARLSQLPRNSLSASQNQLIMELEEACQSIKLSISNQTTFVSSFEFQFDSPSTGIMEQILREMAYAIQAFAVADVFEETVQSAISEKKLENDSLSKQIYVKFAAKTILAALICYIFYDSMQWPGIHTAVITCFILALPSLGAVSHKGLTRIIGCALGSAVSLFAVVFILPQLETITGLLLLSLPIIAIGAWISAGSARTNYIGLQFIFAYALAILGQFGPTTNLTEIRDRLIGILIGVIVYITISTLLWPEREGAVLRNSLAKLFKSIAGLVRADTNDVDKALFQAKTLLSQNRELQGRVALEPGWQYAQNSVTQEITTLLAEAQETLFAVHWMQLTILRENTASYEQITEAITHFKDSAVAVIEEVSATLLGDKIDFIEKDETLLFALKRLNLACKCDKDNLQDLSHSLCQAAHNVYIHITRLQYKLISSSAY